MNDILQTLLPGGLIAAILMLAKAYKDWKRQREERETTLLTRFKDDNTQLRNDLDFTEQECDWWRNRAGDLEHALRSAGIAVPSAPASKPRRSDHHDHQ